MSEEEQYEINDKLCAEARIKAGLTRGVPEDLDCESGCILYKNGCPLTERKDDTPKSRFINLLMSTNRSGIAELIVYLNSETDFFEAPASSNNHGNYRYGLLEHSLACYDHYMALKPLYTVTTKPDTDIIITLLHDLCKANFYKPDTRNVKNANGEWEKVPYFSIDDKLPLGHGEKSALLLQMYVQLTIEEIMAIRWHMAGYDDTARSYSGNLALNNAMDKYPIIALLHMSDLSAVNLKIKGVVING